MIFVVTCQEDATSGCAGDAVDPPPVVTILGPVVVTRNPCMHPGDIRVLTAVEPPPGLKHLRDVIVFPVKVSQCVWVGGCV
jgi:hypothetical protein